MGDCDWSDVFIGVGSLLIGPMTGEFFDHWDFRGGEGGG